MPDAALLRVGARFLALFLVMAAVITFVAIRHGLDWLMVGTASISAALMNATGLPTRLTGPILALPGRSLSVGLACTSAFVVIMYSALVLAYPVNARLKAVGLAVGIPVILAANVGRIVLVAHVARWWPGAFGLVHDYLFEVGMVLVTAAVWASWLSVARRHAR